LPFFINHPSLHIFLFEYYTIILLEDFTTYSLKMELKNESVIHSPEINTMKTKLEKISLDKTGNMLYYPNIVMLLKLI